MRPSTVQIYGRVKVEMQNPELLVILLGLTNDEN
jgi:hypothetical protein